MKARCFSDFFSASVGIFSCHRRNIQRRGKIIDYGIEHKLNSFVFQRRTCIDRIDFSSNNRLSKSLFDFFKSWLLSFEVVCHEYVIMLNNFLNEFCSESVDFADTNLIQPFVAEQFGTIVDAGSPHKQTESAVPEKSPEKGSGE